MAIMDCSVIYIIFHLLEEAKCRIMPSFILTQIFFTNALPLENLSFLSIKKSKTDPKKAEDAFRPSHRL